jgi:5-methylcytosine-specific restriction protein A
LQPVVRIRGRRLQKLREDLFAREPLCRNCRRRAAVIRDHVVPLAEGGTDTEDNTQGLCQSCSDVKSHREANRGREVTR